MARLPLLDPSDADPPAAELLSRIAGERGRAFNVYRVLANSPGVLERVYGLAGYLWRESELGPKLTELAILRVALLTASDYEWCRHRELARRAGVGDAQVAALATWAEPDSPFDPIERAVLTLVDETTIEVEASEQAVAAVRGALGERATLELIVLAGFYGMVSRLLRSLDVDPELGDGVVGTVGREANSE